MELESAMFAVLDVETTGLSHEQGHRVCEVGAIKLRAGKEIDRYHTLVHPGMPMPEEARKIHKISDDMIKEAPPFATIARPLREFLAGTVMIAQNARFDLGFINSEFIRSGHGRLAIPVVDTVTLARRVRPGLSGYSLDRLAHHFQIPVDSRHRALGDCEVTVRVFLECLKTLRQKGEVRSVEDLVKRGGVNGTETTRVEVAGGRPSGQALPNVF
ncbi:MAG TPA: 3'-5' exonuclease [Planctomycetota bacterium]|nr:3'-5' exonuclease [Planctomycetota bacterium]